MIGRYRFGSTAEAAFLRSFADGDLVVANLLEEDFGRMAQLVEQYADFPLGGSDARVIAIAERSRSPRSSPPIVATSPRSARNTSKRSTSCRRQGSSRDGAGGRDSNRRPTAYKAARPR